MIDDDDIKSPCVRICVMDATSGLCRGCRRTLAEIAQWTSYTHPEKLAVLARIAHRPEPATVEKAGCASR